MERKQAARKVGVGQVTISSYPPPLARHPIRPRPGGLAALPQQTLTEPTLFVLGAKLDAVSQDRR